MRAVTMTALTLQLWVILLALFGDSVSSLQVEKNKNTGAASAASAATRLATEQEHESSAELSRALSKR
jgi:hypothetical protein